MKKHFLYGLALAAVMAGPAVAADMRVKAAPPPIAAVYDWSGLYFGGNVGGQWAEVDRFYPQAIGGPLNARTRIDDVFVGFHGGAQAQWQNFVLGFEVAYSVQGTGTGRVALPTPPFAVDLSAHHRIGNLLTVGPRLGYAWNDVLIYGTGGYAYAPITAEYASTLTGAPRFPGFWGESKNSGWFAGVGVEYVVHKSALVDIIVGAEYQHIDLGEKNSFCFNPGCNPANAEDYRTGATIDVVRARLSIKTHGWFLRRS